MDIEFVGDKFILSMNQKIKINLMSWNVRGLNDRKKRLAVRQTILLERPDIVTLQETKLQAIDMNTFREMCGRQIDQHVHIPAQGTRGGLLIAWRQNKYTAIQTEAKQYTLTITFRNNSDASTMIFTAVYGPTEQNQREVFYNELREAQLIQNTPWAIAGDFNVTAAPEDRNVTDSGWRNTLAFAELISELGLLNLNLAGRHYTWSSERPSPHMARLDRFLISADWNSKFPNSAQKAMPNSSSDHCPLILTAQTGLKKRDFSDLKTCG